MRVLFLLALLASPALATVPAPLAAAVGAFRPDPPREWSYTQVSAGAGQSTTERYDATKPEFERWSLTEKNGRPPTANEATEYREIRSRRSRGGTAPKLTDQFDLEHATLREETAALLIYRCPLKPSEAGDRTAQYLQATLTVDRTTQTLTGIELANTEPFSPTFGVKIREMRTTMTYLPAGPDRPALPRQVTTRVRGTAFWFKSLDADLTVSYSEFERARKKN